tara:strand:+ start:117 stop:428 length:312 start_codon:yes stop_codon:yes gene_type:complete
MYGEFFYDEVGFVKIDTGFFKKDRIQYRLTSDPSVVLSILADTHIRLIEPPGYQPPPNQLPSSFMLIAPMDGVKVVNGNVPSSSIRGMDHTQYLNLRYQYQGV